MGLSVCSERPKLHLQAVRLVTVSQAGANSSVRFLQAVGKFPAVCAEYTDGRNSEDICRRTLATMFAHFTQETGGHNPAGEVEEWRQGLVYLREAGCQDTGPGCG